MARIAVLLVLIGAAACSSHLGRPDTTGRPDAVQSPGLARVEFTVTRDTVYTPADWPQPLAADVYRPSGAAPFPAIVMVHGGGWERRSREDMSGLSRDVAARGYVVMNVSYRFAPQWRFPAQLADVQQAVLWLRGHAAEHGVDEDRIGVWGYSAGAHLAALVGVTSPGDPQFAEGARVQAVVGGGTPVDLRSYPESPLVKALMGIEYRQNAELWRQASPVALVTADDPPTFLYHGTFDLTVNDDNAHAMFDALRSSNVPAELYLARGQGHISTFLLDAPVQRGIEFLDRYLR